MGCGASSSNQQQAAKQNQRGSTSSSKPKDGGDDMQAVGPAASPGRSPSKTKEKVKGTVDDALYEEGESERPTESAETKEFGEPVQSRIHTNTQRSSLVGYSFGDNDGVQTVGEEEGGDVAGQDTVSPSTESIAIRKGSRRIAVSAEPILPDEAEKFNPRYIEKDEETVAVLREVTVGNYLFASMEPEELNTVIGAMENESFAQGEDVLKQGEDSTEKFYFIMEGRVDILKSEILENNGYVCSFAKGQTFGELELMYLAPCAATVRCATNVEVYSIDRDTYRHIVMMVSIRKRRLYKELLGAVPFLQGMSDYDAMTLADALSPINFAPGEKILTFGKRSEWMYIIVTGVVKVVGRDPNDETKKTDVCDLGPGETLGELEFLKGHPAVADCIVKDDDPLKACRLHRAHFEMCMGPVVEFLEKNARSEKYSYYQNVVSEEEGGSFAHFTFGETTEDEGFKAFGEGADGEVGEGANDEADDDAAEAVATERTRRIAVSDESAEEVDENWVPPVFEKSDEQRAMLKSVLRQNPLLGHMEGTDLDTLIGAMESLSYPQGTYILTQGGDGGTHYYVITKGVVEILKQEQLVCTFSIGQGFGEMELMYIQPCVASVKARTEVDTWAIDRATYKKLVMQLAIKRRELYTELLQKIDFLSGMDDYECHTLADALTPEEFEAGQSLIRRGETNEWMFIVIDGKVEVLGVDDTGNDDSRKHICYLERGACVGELEFLNQHRAVADCVAATPLRVAKLHREHFELCMGPVVDVLRRTVRQDKYQYYQQQLEELSSPAAGGPGRARRGRAKAVSAEVMESGGDDNWEPPSIPKADEELQQLQVLLKKSPLFAAMPAQDRDVVIAALHQQTFAKDTVLVKQGEIPDEAFWSIVQSGRAEQRVTDESTGSTSVVASFTAGHAFGELELMYSTPAIATTIVTSDELTVFRLDRKTYRKIVMKLSTERRALYKELLSGVPFLTSLSESQQDTIADALSPVKFGPGDYLVRYGSHNDWMYIIADGVVEVFSNANEKICELRRGEMVGELEFLHSHAAVADCVAKTHVSACRLHRDHFELCLGPVEDYIEEVLKSEKYSYYNAKRKEGAA